MIGTEYFVRGHRARRDLPPARRALALRPRRRLVRRGREPGRRATRRRPCRRRRARPRSAPVSPGRAEQAPPRRRRPSREEARLLGPPVRPPRRRTAKTDEEGPRRPTGGRASRLPMPFRDVIGHAPPDRRCSPARCSAGRCRRRCCLAGPAGVGKWRVGPGAGASASTARRRWTAMPAAPAARAIASRAASTSTSSRSTPDDAGTIKIDPVRDALYAHRLPAVRGPAPRRRRPRRRCAARERAERAAQVARGAAAGDDVRPHVGAPDALLRTVRSRTMRLAFGRLDDRRRGAAARARPRLTPPTRPAGRRCSPMAASAPRWRSGRPTSSASRARGDPRLLGGRRARATWPRGWPSPRTSSASPSCTPPGAGGGAARRLVADPRSRHRACRRRPRARWPTATPPTSLERLAAQAAGAGAPGVAFADHRPRPVALERNAGTKLVVDRCWVERDRASRPPDRGRCRSRRHIARSLDIARVYRAMKPRIAITVGDPAGIGPGDRRQGRRRSRGARRLRAGHLRDGRPTSPMGQVSAAAGRAAYDTLVRAVGRRAGRRRSTRSPPRRSTRLRSRGRPAVEGPHRSAGAPVRRAARGDDVPRAAAEGRAGHRARASARRAGAAHPRALVAATIALTARELPRVRRRPCRGSPWPASIPHAGEGGLLGTEDDDVLAPAVARRPRRRAST